MKKILVLALIAFSPLGASVLVQHLGVRVRVGDWLNGAPPMTRTAQASPVVGTAAPSAMPTAR